jgi:CubicO group peptidase (beta-lactamase class C family)
MSVPGSEYLYSTHGFTLLAAVIEKVTGVPFNKVI